LTYGIIYYIIKLKGDVMKIEIDEKILNDYRNNIMGLSSKKTYSEIIEYLLKEKLILGGFDGYEIDNLSGLLTLSRLKIDINNIITNILRRKQIGFYSTILYFNINNMKEYNDINGFSKGDKLIKEFSHKLIELYDEKKYRIGGQEFVIVSFEDIELKNILTIDNIKLNQYKIAIKYKEINYPVTKDYLRIILRRIDDIKKIKIEKIYKLLIY
jgi:GGDEF domain-containing protein